jgi:GNAT superfamily N-acetyltransferase
VPSLPVGRRASVRVRLPGGSVSTDVVGTITTVDEHTLTLRRRDGSTERLLRADVVAVRLLADAGPPRRADGEQLQRLAATAWPAPVTEPLGDWLLRAADGFTGRANSASVHGSPGVPIAQALHCIERFYADRGLPARAQVVRGSPWEEVFAGASWRPAGGGPGAPYPGAVVLTASVADTLAVSSPVEAVPVREQLSVEWLGRYGRTAAMLTAGEDLTAAREVLGARGALQAGSVDSVGLAQLDAAPGEPAVAVGRMVVIGAWASMACVEVDPRRRGEGLGRRVVQTLLSWSRAQGARWCLLQTLPDNAAALALYSSYGFTQHSSYRYLSPPA